MAKWLMFVCMVKLSYNWYVKMNYNQFFDINEVVPDYLVDILGLNDGMRII